MSDELYRKVKYAIELTAAISGGIFLVSTFISTFAFVGLIISFVASIVQDYIPQKEDSINNEPCV